MELRVDNKYFHPRHFIGNNIEYRIGSSSALAKFKEAQSFTLNQLALNPFHKFSTTAKEILLFKYDLAFDLMCEIEQYLLVTEYHNYNIDDIFKMIDLRWNYFKSTLKEQENIKQEYFERWLELHSLIRNTFRNKIKDIISMGLRPASIFGSIIDVYINVINHTLYVLQELDIIYFTDDTPIFNLDMYSCKFGNIEEISPLYNRIQNLKEVRNFNEIIIKNYLDISIPFESTAVYKYLTRDNIKYTII